MFKKVVKHLLTRGAICNVANIIYYHGVGDDVYFLKGLGLNLSEKAFKEQLMFLRKKYKIISLNEFLQTLSAKDKMKGMVVLTFDDAYRNLLRYAIPLLVKYKLPATINVISGLVGNKRLYWRSKLIYIIQQGLGKKLVNILRKYYNDKETANLSTNNILTWTIEQYSRNVDLAFQDIFDEHMIDEEELAGEANLFWDISDFEKIDKEYISFGNHTHTHPVLARLPEDDQKQEIMQGEIFLNYHAGISAPSFSIPFGSGKHFFSKTSKKLVIDSKHSCILYCAGGVNDISSDRYCLSRKFIDNDKLERFKYLLQQT